MPMEVDEASSINNRYADPPLREILSAMATSLRVLQDELAKIKNNPSAKDSGNKNAIECWYCGKRGHLQKGCHKKKRIWQEETFNPPPITPLQKYKKYRNINDRVSRFNLVIGI